MRATIPTYASLTESGYTCSDVCGALIRHTGRPFRFDPWNGSSFTERANGHPVYVSRDNERADVWNVSVVDTDTGRPLTDPAPVAVVVSAGASLDAIAQAIAPHVLALVAE